MADNRAALAALKRSELIDLVDRLELTVDDRRVRDQLLDVLASAPHDALASALEGLPRTRLKAACRTLGLDDGGRAKAPIVARLLGDASSPAATSPGIQARAVETGMPATLSPVERPTTTRTPQAPAAGGTMQRFSEKVSFIWSVADLLRGDFKQSEYGRVILPFTVLRRLDQVLAPTRQAVWDADRASADAPPALRDQMLLRASGQSFYNRSKLDFASLLADPTHLAQNLVGYIHGFSQNARDILERFRFENQVERLDRADLLFLVTQKFGGIDLHPDQVSNLEMGYIFEELIRKFSEQSNETAGEHFTPREVIRLMVHLLFVEDEEALGRPGMVRTIYDPACGTGGMLSVAEEYLAERNPHARLEVFGQELNGESYAICKADMLIKGQQAHQMQYGNSFSEDCHPTLRTDYLISNPPFGVDWTKAEKAVRDEHERLGHAGRFGPGLPRKNDGSLLFLLHMMSKMKAPGDGGSRLAIVFNGSPLFTGAAASGESEIRRHLLENDLLEAIVALPDQMFYNTGIATYVWIVTNRKPAARRGTVQLINGVDQFQKVRKSLGNKRKELADGHIAELVRRFDAFEEGPAVKVFANEDFGFRRITVERPLQLAFQASAERIARLEDERGWQNLVTSRKKGAKAEAEITAGRETQARVRRCFARLDPEHRYTARPDFRADLKAAATAEGLTITATLRKTIESALGERDEAAEVCRVKGQPEPDPELRDHENVPLREDIDEYLAREVLSHVPDAWVDETKTKIGYEIPFTRHFYEYTPSRPLEVIEAEIRALDGEIRGMLDEVFA